MAVTVQKVRNYFGSLNPLAEKISADINDISGAYADLWSTFSNDEQNELIDVTLIKPNLILKYVDELKNERNLKKRRSSGMLSKDETTIITDTDSNDWVSLSSSNSNSYRSNDFSHIYLFNGKDLCTYGQIITALRNNQDDLCGVYRDEHSEPFNSKTKSQMNLNFTNTADASAKYERAQKKFPEIKLPFAGIDAIDGVMKKGGGVDHVPELRAKLAGLNKGTAGATLELSQDGSVVRKSFMTRLFSGKSSTMPINVPSPKVLAPLDSLASIDLGIDSSSKNFDSMSTKSATSSKPDEINDMSRLIDANENDGDDDDLSNILNKSGDYDFLNNW